MDENCTEIVRSVFFLHSGFIVGRKWIISMIYHLINHQNTELNAETKEHA